MKKILTLAVAVLMAMPLFAQTKANDTLRVRDTSWSFEGIGQINFSQVALSNWQGGGQSTLAGAGFLHLGATYESGRRKWVNKLDAGYGLIQQGGREALVRKSDDQLKIVSQYIYKLKGNFNYVNMADFQTTFMPGYKYREDSTGEEYQAELLSRFMAPGYLILASGPEYRLNDRFYAFLAPVSGKLTFMFDDSLSQAGAFGVKPGRNLRAELGVNFKTSLKQPVMQGVDFETELNLFANYRTPEQIDVIWINQLLIKANDIFTAKIGTHLIYDQDILIKREDGTQGPDTKFKEVLTIGIQYKFI